MIQFKEKSKKQQGGGGNGESSVGVGLFTYPTLMAADIMLYQTTKVPVGEDQRQHLELTRDIVRRFHDLFCKGNQFKKRMKAAGIPTRPVFVEPEPFILKADNNDDIGQGGVAVSVARIMSLSDGTSKMSKSDANDGSRINVLDPPDVIRDKIKRCKTDAFEGIEWDNPERPEATNLLNIYAAVLQQPGGGDGGRGCRSKEDIMEDVKDMNWGTFKPILADAIVNHLEPIQKRYHEVRQDEEKLNQILKDGAASANEVAQRTLHATKVAMGFATPK